MVSSLNYTKRIWDKLRTGSPGFLAREVIENEKLFIVNKIWSMTNKNEILRVWTMSFIDFKGSET